MSNKTEIKSGGVGFLGLLTIVFIVLKLTGHVTWSWFWVLSPLFLQIAIIIVVLIALIIVAIAANR